MGYRFEPPHTSNRKMAGTMAFALIVSSALHFCACTATQKDAWKTFGVDALKCAGTGLLNEAASVITDLLGKVYGTSDVEFNPEKILTDLETKYSPEAITCGLGKVASDLLPVLNGHAARAEINSPLARRIQALLDADAMHVKARAKKVK